MPGEILPRVLVLLFLFANLAAVTFLETIKNLVLRLLNLNVPSEKKKKGLSCSCCFYFLFLGQQKLEFKRQTRKQQQQRPKYHQNPVAFGFGIMAHYQDYSPMSMSLHSDWISLYDPYDDQDFLEYIAFLCVCRRP